jgi:thiol-disulfide isomerase/thioredoxin
MLLLLCIRLNLTQAEWARITTAPDHPPVFIFAWTPWCGHCRAAMPAWRKLGAELAPSASVALASLNCEAEGRLCQAFGTRAYPTFYDYFRGFLRRARLSDRSFAAFAGEAERLRRVAKGEFVIAKVSQHPPFPHFVFRVGRADNASKAVAREVAARSRFLLDARFYFDFVNATEPRVTVFVSRGDSVEMKGEFSAAAVAAFVGEYPIAPFGGWKFDEIEQVRRLFAIYVETEGVKPPDSIVRWAKGVAGEVLFGKSDSLSQKKIDTLFHTQQATVPLVVFMNIQKRKYCVIERATIEKLDAFLEKYRAGNATMVPLDKGVFSPRGKTAEKEEPVVAVEEEGGDAGSIGIEKNSAVSIPIIAGGVVIVCAVFQFVRRGLAAKQD